MTPLQLPSAELPEAEKRGFSELDVHSKLFEPDMATLGYPRRSNTQADGEYFLEQGQLALRQLKTQRIRGAYDGLYLIGNPSIVLCEIKRYEALNSQRALEEAD